MTSGTPPRKAFLPEDSVPPPSTVQHIMKLALWLIVARSVCLFPGFQDLISHSCSQKTYSQVIQSIPSSLGLRILPLKSSQWRVNCDCCPSFPYTVVQLPRQPHKYMTEFLKKWHGQKFYTLIVMFPVGASFKAGLIVVWANCPNQQVEVSRKQPANCVIMFFHK